ncbi:molybdate ABC transporter permease subunit [Sphingomonas aestuarii]
MISSAEWVVIALSLRVGLVAVVATLPIAYALAWLLARRDFAGKLLLDGAIHLPLVLPPVVTGWLLLLAFAPNGPMGAAIEGLTGGTVLFRWTGAAIAAGVMALPLMVRAIRLGIEGVDVRMEGVARTLGAGRWRSFVRVTLPLSLPGIVAGVVLGFARALGEFGATITFVSNVPGETRTLPIAIYSLLQTPGGEGAVLRLAAISVVLSLGALVASEWIARRARVAMPL